MKLKSNGRFEAISRRSDPFEKPHNTPVSFRFELVAADPESGARAGLLHTPHGVIETPAFMPVGTRAAVKAMAQEELEALGARLLLANTYHLVLRPGAARIRELGGLHGFMAWPHALLTDSGGFQVFSLRALAQVSEQGVRFRSHLDGQLHDFTPEQVVDAQLDLGADIIMPLDECTRWPAAADAARASLELTLRWLERARRRWLERDRGTSLCRAGRPGFEQALFGIVQGGMHPALRAEAAQRLAALDLPGYALGGLSVGEPRELTWQAAAAALPHLPAGKPRYAMGVGAPAELAEYVALGVDMMDCVLPTRNARNGLLFTSAGRLSIKAAALADDPAPPDPLCACSVCARYSRAYLRHLFQSNEILASMLLTRHNLFHYLDTLRRIRHAIVSGQFSRLRQQFAAPA